MLHPFSLPHTLKCPKHPILHPKFLDALSPAFIRDMFFTSLLVTALAISNTSAPSLPKRVSAPTVDDGIILNFALTLEFLQRAFYEGALAQFTQADFVAAGFADPVYANLQAVYFDERRHVEFLTLALLAAGIEPTGELEYEFPYTDVASFVGLASVIEGVSVSAYLGALSSIEDPDYLTAFGSILGVEARQSSSIRAGLGEAPFPNPFDTPLDFNEAHTLALPFITNFNSGPVKLPFTAFPNLTLQCAPDYYEAGRSSVTFTGAFAAAEKLGITKDTDVFAVFISGLLKLPVLAQITNNYSDYMVDEIPIGVSGQAYVVLSNSCIDPSDENIIAGPAVLEVYPTEVVPSTPHAGCPAESLPC